MCAASDHGRGDLSPAPLSWTDVPRDGAGRAGGCPPVSWRPSVTGWRRGTLVLGAAGAHPVPVSPTHPQDSDPTMPLPHRAPASLPAVDPLVIDSCDVPHWFDAGLTDVDCPHWLTGAYARDAGAGADVARLPRPVAGRGLARVA